MWYASTGTGPIYEKEAPERESARVSPNHSTGVNPALELDAPEMHALSNYTHTSFLVGTKLCFAQGRSLLCSNEIL